MARWDTRARLMNHPLTPLQRDPLWTDAGRGVPTPIIPFSFTQLIQAMRNIVLSPRMGLLAVPVLLELWGPAAHAQTPAPLTDVSVYPNPAHIRATVEVPAVPGVARASVMLLDAQGTVVFEQPVSLTDAGGTAEVPLLGRAPGLYRVQVQVGDQRVAKTLKVE